MNVIKAFLPIVILSLASVGFVVFLLFVSFNRSLTSLELVLLEILILGTGVSASYLFAQRSAKLAAEQLLATSKFGTL